jgi:hypothetical protein
MVDTHPPAVSGGTPTITDAAEVSAPGWLEFDPLVLKDIDFDHNSGTPFSFKYTTYNNRLQYLLASDGVVWLGNTTGVGDTYPGIHYRFLDEQKSGFDVAAKAILKVPTASEAVGGTGKFDYSGYLLASRDFTKWGFHGDFNAGLSELSRVGQSYVQQVLLSGSTTSPIQGGRWQYTNELVYFSGTPGNPYRLTGMNGFSYAVHRYETYSVGLQNAFHGDIAHWQLLFTGSFNIDVGGHPKASAAPGD